MPVPLNIHRLRHIHSYPTQHASRSSWDWAKVLDAVNEIAAITVQSGLVHALLFALRAPPRKTEYRHLIGAIRSWLDSKDCPVKAEVAAALMTPLPDNIVDADAVLTASLMYLDSVADAMAIQAEVIRYLSQAKIVAQAFKQTKLS